MSDNVTDENFDKIHEAIDETITGLEDSGSELGDIALCMFVEGANILEDGFIKGRDQRNGVRFSIF